MSSLNEKRANANHVRYKYGNNIMNVFIIYLFIYLFIVIVIVIVSTTQRPSSRYSISNSNRSGDNGRTKSRQGKWQQAYCPTLA